jgi:peptidoglycan/LPS O-acetylase OafA/YrhL
LLYRDYQFREGFRYTIQAVGLVLIIRYVILAPASPAGRVLNARPVVWIGQLSYAFYLVHQILIYEVEKRLTGRLIVASVALVLSVGASWLLQRLVVNPASTIRKRLDARRATALQSLAT